MNMMLPVTAMNASPVASANATYLLTCDQLCNRRTLRWMLSIRSRNPVAACNSTSGCDGDTGVSV